MDQDTMIISRIGDKIEQCRRGFYITSTGFLDLHEQSLAKRVCRENGDIRTFFYGGYEDAERRMLICSPPDLADTLEEVLQMGEYLRVIHIDVKEGGKKLTHRDYLGSVLGLGLDRSVTGDILVHDGGAEMIVLPEIVDFLMTEYTNAGRTYLQLSDASIEDLQVPEQHIKMIRDTIPSLRLDNAVSTAFQISRSDAVTAIKRGLVFVDHEEQSKVDRKIEEGAVIVLRGKGKARLNEVGGVSKKGRTWVEFARYV